MPLPFSKKPQKALNMQYSASPSKRSAILGLRQQYLQETNFQLRYHACHDV